MWVPADDIAFAPRFVVPFGQLSVSSNFEMEDTQIYTQEWKFRNFMFLP